MLEGMPHEMMEPVRGERAQAGELFGDAEPTIGHGKESQNNERCRHRPRSLGGVFRFGGPRVS
jgi:hypothetical protein